MANPLATSSTDVCPFQKTELVVCDETVTKTCTDCRFNQSVDLQKSCQKD